MKNTSDINVTRTDALPTPRQLISEYDKTEAQAEFISQSRDEIHEIIFGGDKRLLVVIGPCSIHDTEAGLEYAKRLAALSEKVKDRICLVMRVYFEKPRTSLGWKGLIMDPDLDGSENIKKGLRVAREFLRKVIDLGLPTSTELLDPITPQYIADLVSWAAIGARTTESQTHRQMASGLSMPLGFKNGMDGTVGVAVNAIKAASGSQTFLGINTDGQASAVTTKGNPNCHVVLRGGSGGPNYDADSVAKCEADLKKAGLIPAIMVDCSHGNSNKDHNRQPIVLDDIMNQIAAGNDSIIGVMVESNLGAGNQKFPVPKEELAYGVSITDACIDWETTETAILSAYEKMGARFAAKK
ncbi:3-deoxy-7-phosphoheptulonate synthase [Pelagicoccus sp. NFK12]|uniref:Phospho-2-dehydro-3-deoxyheptonate aldolase n=1 Tax=Pelagicoccus enzymogenes TaxID=2773457 RepID=A0A927FC00_9BACT|nr:3-deoxy-7-phosphoheptulonate synthase [Pelagicoccus enzymogenes]MBD5782064.1 3-deoxy-7-phosphoheptulonate synthase [Pelagicoccus enzymogenes]MDQ8196818.1 3-deoxy-7-phosphoheptulonate synthase [Pelagicoccus enzymogenes]